MTAAARRLAIAVMLTLFAVALAAAQGLTPHDIARLRSVAAVAVSPDGQSIAYTIVVPRQPLVDEDGPAWTELHVAGPDNASRPFVTGKVNVAGVRWTPDGKGIAFLARRTDDQARALYVMPVAGGEARRVLAHETDILSVSFSPDGTRVAFTARDAVAKEQRDLQRKGFSQEVYEESAPFVRVFVASLDGTPPKRLPLDGSASDVTWSPVGNRLALALAPTPLVDDDYMARRVHVVDADTGAIVGKLDNRGKLGEIAWSPDASHLAFISGADINDPAPGRLMVAPAAGGSLRDVLPDYLGHVRALAWKDAETIRFIADEGTETVFAEVKRDGSARKTIVPKGSVLLSAFDQGGARSLAFLAQTPRHPPELYVMRGGETTPRRVTDSNPWLADRRLAKQETVTFKARDGLELEGVLVYPLDYQAGSRYPLILTVHGGPEANDRNGWVTGYSNPGQVAAARGFAVFYPNYRGSTGRGVAFSKLSQGDPAGKEFDDLVDAIDHLVNIGLVDRAKVGITGGSYGGYASAWGATYYSDRFAASVMFVGISNNVSRIGTTDIPNEEVLVHALKHPWDNWTFSLERSPIYYADRSKTPTLILGGTSDPRVSPTQSMELYRHLKLRGKAPVRLVRYPGEQHGNARAASRLDYNLRMLRWMEHYLKGPGGDPPPYEIDYAEPKAEAAPAR